MITPAIFFAILLLVIAATAAVIVSARKRAAAAARQARPSPQSDGSLRSAIASAQGENAPAPPPVPIVAPEPQPEPEPEPEPTAAELVAWGDAHKAVFDYDDAIGAYEQALDAVAAEHGRESLAFAELLIKSEDAYFARDNGDDSAEANCDGYKRALAITERLVGPYDERLLPVLGRIISFYFYQGKVMEAETLMRRQGLISLRVSQGATTTGALAAEITLFASGNVSVDEAVALGDASRAAFQYEEAVSHYSEALEAAQEAFGRDSIKLVPLLLRLSETFFARDIMDTDSDGSFYSDPVDYGQLALALAVRAVGPRDGSLAPLLVNLAALSDLNGDHYKAERYAAMLDGLSR